MNMKNSVILCSVLFCMSVFADASGTWTNTVGGFWSDVNNWNNGIVPSGRGHYAIFGETGVSVTNDAAVPVGVVKFNAGHVNLYGNPLVLDATTPKIILNSGTTYFRSSVVASNGLTVTAENGMDNRGHFYQRNEIGAGGLTVDRSRAKPFGAELAPLPGDSGVINSVFTTNTIDMYLSQGGRYNQIGSQNYDTFQDFSSIYLIDRGYLEPYVNSSTYTSYITADDLAGPGLLRIIGIGAVQFASAARFSGSVTDSSLDLEITGNAQTAELKPAAGAIMHLDASDLSSFTTELENGTNFVIRWDSQVPGNWAEHDGYLTGGERKLPWIKENVLNGMPIVDFAEMKDLTYATRSEAPYLLWHTRRTDIKAAFAALRSQNFIFTDIYGGLGHYHHFRDMAGGAYRWDQRLLNLGRTEMHNSFKNGESIIMVNDTKVTDLNSYRLSASNFDVVAMVVKEGATAVGSIAHDRAWRYGGQQVAEEIFYDRVLTDAEIEATVAYLRNKWMGVAVTPADNDAPAHLFEAVNNGRMRVNVESNAVVSVDNFMGLGSREVQGEGTVRAERGALRPEKPLELNGADLELVNAGEAVDTSLSELDLSGMFFHLDASDLSSMTLDGDKVLEWRGESNVTNGLLAYAMNTVDNPAPTLSTGRLNGLPVVDFGDWGAGSMMHWNHTNTNIRTLFMVFDHIYSMSFWLSDVYDGNRAHFHRGDAGLIFYTGYVSDALRSGQVHVNGKRVDPSATYIPREEPFLISFTCVDGSAARAACMAADRYPHATHGPKFRTGGQRIAEVVVYDRHLSTSEREQVEGYLLRKWMPTAPAGFVSTDDSHTFDGVIAGPTTSSLSVGDSQDAVLGTLDGVGPVEKLGAGTLAVGSLAGLSGDLNVKEGALRIAQRALPDPYTLPGSIAFHLDASDSASIHVDTDGASITNISDAAGGSRYATPANAGIPPQLLPNELNGKPVISFLAADSGCAALWNERVTGIQTVFWVLGSQEGGGIPLGTKESADGSNFNRSSIDNAADPIWGGDALAHYGVTRINGAIVDGLNVGFSGGYQLMSLVANQGLTASAFATQKNTDLFGGQRLAEVIVYDRLLLDQERRDVEAYLARKWFGAPTSGYAGGDVAISRLNVDGGAVELPEDVDVAIDSVAGTVDLVKDGGGILSVSELSNLAGAVVVSNGTFRLSGAPAIPELPTNMLMHMDASVTSSFDIVAENNTNFITRWDSLYGAHYAAHDGVSKRPWILYDELNGLPVVNFGPYRRSGWGNTAADGAYLDWDQEISSIRSGFLVLGSQDGGNFVVGWGGDSTIADFHRGYGGGTGYVTADGVIIATGRVEPPDYISSANSYWSLDSEQINPGSTGLSGGYQSLCFTSDPDYAPDNALHGSTFARDRNYRWGGQRLAEFVIYDRVLTERERADAEDYLRAKWFGEIPVGRYLDGNVPLIEVYGSGVVDVSGNSRSVGTLRGNGTVSNGTLVVTETLDVGGSSVAELSVDNIKLAAGCIMPVDISDSSADSVSVNETVIFGESGTVSVRGDTTPGNYDLFIASSVSGASNLDSWRVTGLPEGVAGKLSLSGSSVVLRILAEGTLIILR